MLPLALVEVDDDGLAAGFESELLEGDPDEDELGVDDPRELLEEPLEDPLLRLSRLESSPRPRPSRPRSLPRSLLRSPPPSPRLSI